MPHFQIKLLEGKSEEQKQQLAEAVIKAAQGVIGLGDESYSVSIKDYTLDEWKTTIYPNEIIGEKESLYKFPGYEM